jgi:serine/threonine protein kinase
MKAQAVTNWEQITSLFGAARLLDPEIRRVFLDAACGEDPALRSEVERLLADGGREDSFMSEPVWADAFSALALTPSLDPGDVVNHRYCIEASVAGGGQALVYRATDTVLSRPVIVKVMRASGRHNLLLNSRFEQEMKALSRIDHPGVVGILDVGELEDGCPFLVIQYVNGVSLREELQKGPLEPPRAAHLLRELGSALSAAHAAGVAHRDVKPENIMLQRLSDGSETIKLIDFGICKIDRASLGEGIATVSVAGTIRYMAPEQFEGENSTACDTYSLALVVCEMLSGQPDSRGLPKKFGAVTRQLLDSALAFRPENRPQDVRRWCEELATSLLDLAHPRRRRLRAAAILALAALLVAAAVRYLPQLASEPRRSIEKIGAFDPLIEGFQIHNELRGVVSDNPDHSGYDGWTVSTARMGHYFRNLTRAEKRLALERGWRLTATMRLEEGLCFAVIDFGGVGKRFDIQLRRAGADDLVRLQTQILPTSQGVDLLLPHDADAYHAYELRYDPGLQVADLWIDGVRRLTGYPGHSQFQVDGDLLFGVAVLGSAQAVASFQHVRFEINP